MALSGVASAQPWYGPSRNLPQNNQPQTEERYQPQNRLAEVRLDPNNNRAYIQLPRTGRPLDYLELRAGRGRIQLDDVEVIFSDGSRIRTGDRGVVEPNQGRVVDLPRNSLPVTAINIHYRTMNNNRWNRFGSRLEVFGVREHRYGNRDYDRRYYRRPGRG